MIETEYAKLVRKPGPSCAADLGRIDLLLEETGGAITKLVNAGTSCGDAPPEVAEDLAAFQSRVFTITR